MRVLVGCEFSGRVRDAFIARGHNAISCDLVPSTAPGPHIVGDVLEVLHDGWDLALFFPPCTYLCRSGLHWNLRPGHVRFGGVQSALALDFVRTLLDAPIPQIALENPAGLIGSQIRPADQIIQPYQFGDDASKKTCLWLKNLPPLPVDPALAVAPRWVAGRPRWGNQTDAGQDKTPSTKRQAQIRSLTYPGIAAAMARTWG